jgi:hypothetical protein
MTENKSCGPQCGCLVKLDRAIRDIDKINAAAWKTNALIIATLVSLVAFLIKEVLF